MRGAGGFGSVAVVVALLVAGCGTERPGEAVVSSASGAPDPTPYTGPLRLPHAEYGAAGEALECDWKPSGGSSESEPWSKGDGGANPEEGLALYFEMDQPGLPTTGYRVEHREGKRVLFSYDVDGRTRIAVVVAKDRPRRPGWGPESSADCDIAEFPPGVAEQKGLEVWTDRAGRRVSTAKVSSAAGPEHCDWEKVHFLGVGRGKHEKTYVRDAEGIFPRSMMRFHGRYDGDATMPADAKDAGYRFKDWRLWLATDKSTAYVRTPDGVEAWPQIRGGCK